MIYIELLMVAVITIFIVDLSGFTQSWKSALAHWLKVKELKPIKPFDCSLCMTWWCCIFYALCRGQFSLPVLTYIALLAYLSLPISQLCIFIYEGMLAVIGKLIDFTQK